MNCVMTQIKQHFLALYVSFKTAQKDVLKEPDKTK